LYLPEETFFTLPNGLAASITSRSWRRKERRHRGVILVLLLVPDRRGFEPFQLSCCRRGLTRRRRRLVLL